MLGCYHAANLLRDILIAITGSVDVESCSTSLKARGDVGSRVLIHRRAVAVGVKESPQNGWEATSCCRRFLILSRKAFIGVEIIGATGVWWWGWWGWRFVEGILPGRGLRCLVEVVPILMR